LAPVIVCFSRTVDEALFALVAGTDASVEAFAAAGVVATAS